MTATSLVLASASPRRSEILRGLEVAFEIQPADIDESRFANEAPDTYVVRVARAKAAAISRPGSLVLAADTIVVIDERVVTKPENPEHAVRILTSLAGREHEVLTAIALVDHSEGGSGEELRLTAIERSRVRMAPMTPQEIDWYVASGEPLDKAGAYAIQGLGALFVEGIEGNYTNVVGLPVPALYRLLKELGYSLLDFRP